MLFRSNITECVWDYVGFEKRKVQPTSKAEHWKVSLLKGMEAVIKVKDGCRTIFLFPLAVEATVCQICVFCFFPDAEK